MRRAILSRDVTILYPDRRGYPVKAKAGTRLQLVRGLYGGKSDGWVIPPGSCDAGGMGKAGTWSIFGHDSKHHYVIPPQRAVQELEESQ